jgi:hypothetical protein
MNGILRLRLSTFCAQLVDNLAVEIVHTVIHR